MCVAMNVGFMSMIRPQKSLTELLQARKLIEKEAAKAEKLVQASKVWL